MAKTTCKFNTDVSTSFQDGGAGFILRYHRGSCSAAGLMYIHNKSTLQCETIAVKLGLQFTINKGLTKLQTDMDSITLANLLTLISIHHGL